MKVLSSQQIREADQYTIKNEPISSIDLMERASQVFVNKFLGLHPEKQFVHIFCGTGNNGGDGLAIARLLLERDWRVVAYIVGNAEKGSPDFKANLKRLSTHKEIVGSSDFPPIESDSIIIDGLFGSGLSRPVKGIVGELIQYLNGQEAQRISIDISSGLFPNKAMSNDGVAFEPDYTLSFQVPKLSFFLPECEKYVGKWRVLDIGLNKEFIEKLPSPFHLTEPDEMKKMIPVRSTFAHKSQVGKLMIVAGSKGKMGAAVLCARAAFKAGAGLINVHTPRCGLDILQVSIPEAMVSTDNGEEYIEGFPETDDTICIGPGLGIEPATVKGMNRFLSVYEKPVIIDADGINILARNKDIIELLPEESILTPHPGEFRTLVGEWKDDFEKLEMLRTFCIKNKLNVVLKGAFSAVCSSLGNIYFNPSGNPVLATAGSGDVLTGMVGALLAQGLAPLEAIRLAVYLHGGAGDEAIRELQTPWIQASDIINFISKAVSSLINS